MFVITVREGVAGLPHATIFIPPERKHQQAKEAGQSQPPMSNLCRNGDAFSRQTRTLNLHLTKSSFG
jgi:hypothetical protein